MPLPESLYEELQQGFKFASRVRVGDVLKEIIPGITPHGLRHQFSTLCRSKGLSLDVTARLMDHSLPGSMTFETYGDWLHKRLREEAAKVWSQVGY